LVVVSGVLLIQTNIFIGKNYINKNKRKVVYATIFQVLFVKRIAKFESKTLDYQYHTVKMFIKLPLLKIKRYLASPFVE
jgi:hypothetical protein